MTILVLSNLYPPDFIGGYEIACAHVVDALRARGHDVQVLTAFPRFPVKCEPHVHRRFKLMDEWNVDAMGKAPLARDLDQAESRFISSANVHVLTAALEEFAPDVVYICNTIGLGGLGLVACLQYLKVPWVWQIGDSVPSYLCHLGDHVVSGLAEEFKRTIRGHYIVVSEQLRHEIESSGVVLNGQVEIIPYWITGPRPAPRSQHYQGGPLRIMSAGQISKHKGSDLLIEAAAMLRDLGHDDFIVDMYGKPNDRFFAYMINRYGLQDRVTIKGPRPQRELMELYAEYDVFAFPTREREPFGMVPLEAAAHGCVPVMTRRCGIGEWLVHGVHCLKVARNAEAFAQTFADVIERKIDLEPIARRAAVTAVRDFHIDTILPRIERLLERAARQPRDGGGDPGDAYRMARMAEQIARALIQERAIA
jgi:glycogen(starch) synthase